jgi:hypothetical protein
MITRSPMRASLKMLTTYLTVERSLIFGCRKIKISLTMNFVRLQLRMEFMRISTVSSFKE